MIRYQQFILFEPSILYNCRYPAVVLLLFIMPGGAVTGKKVTSQMPFKQRRPFRVGYYCNGKDNVSNIEAALRLNRHPAAK